MSFLQRLLARLLPERWVREMERESRSWMARCPCGFERSVWEIGGVRWKAAGRPRQLLSCPRCGETSWHAIERSPEGHRDRQPAPAADGPRA